MYTYTVLIVKNVNLNISKVGKESKSFTNILFSHSASAGQHPVATFMVLVLRQSWHGDAAEGQTLTDYTATETILMNTFLYLMGIFSGL